MNGLIGRLVVRGEIVRLLPALTLAESCNTGSHAGLGLGWYELVTV